MVDPPSKDLKLIRCMDPTVQLCWFAAYRTVRQAGTVFVDPVTGWFVITAPGSQTAAPA